MANPPPERGRIVCFGELLLRLSPPGAERFFQSNRLRTWFGGSEANVAAGIAHLGGRSAYVTRLPENAVGDAALAAVRELFEETGLTADRLYNVTVQPFYLHRTNTVQLAVVFAAFVSEPAEVTLGPEHQASEWLSVNDARDRFAWPREREALDHIVQLLGRGDAGPLEDVLRVR